MYECETHPRGHRSEEARDDCIEKAKRRAKRKAAKEADVLRREDNCARESVEDYVRRRFCIEQTPAVNVAASLNRDYPRRTPPWDWAAVVTVHAEHLRWPVGTEFEDFLAANPEVLLPSEVRRLAGVSDESSRSD